MYRFGLKFGCGSLSAILEHQNHGHLISGSPRQYLVTIIKQFSNFSNGTGKQQKIDDECKLNVCSKFNDSARSASN